MPPTTIVNYPKVVLLADPADPENVFFPDWHKISGRVAYIYKKRSQQNLGISPEWGCVMCCEVCQSGSQAEFTAEMMIHFSGLPNIDNPGVPAFPKIAVCLDCGFSRFSIAEPELSLLAEFSIPISEPTIGQKSVGCWQRFQNSA